MSGECDVCGQVGHVEEAHCAFRKERAMTDGQRNAVAWLQSMGWSVVLMDGGFVATHMYEATAIHATERKTIVMQTEHRTMRTHTVEVRKAATVEVVKAALVEVAAKGGAA